MVFRLYNIIKIIRLNALRIFKLFIFECLVGIIGTYYILFYDYCLLVYFIFATKIIIFLRYCLAYNNMIVTLYIFK